MAVSIDDLLFIIGTKEATIYQLSNDNAALRNELTAALAKTLPPPPSDNVLPFPVTPNGKTD